MGFLQSLTLTNISSTLLAALGLALVIFIHELGHFLVAKWCDVKVERFSIGFGPVILKFTRGETEYALSLLPLGGYVKMLGQDDVDPSQMTSETIARDPRSYPAKSVPQRMAIISAGVIFNIISAVLFFIIAFRFSVHDNPAVIGNLTPGAPAWKAGLRSGDKIVRIGNKVGTKLGFADLRRAVALSADGESIDIEVERNNTRVKLVVVPARNPDDADEMFPSIHAEAENSLKLATMPGKEDRPVQEGMSAERAEPKFLSGDTIVRIDDVVLKSYTEFQRELGRKRAETVTFAVRRDGATESDPLTEIQVEPNRFRTIGVWMAIGQIQSIQTGSPAEKGDSDNRLKVGDTITHVAVDESVLQVGKDIDPMRLPDFFGKNVEKPVTVTARRDVNGGNPVTVQVKITPEDRQEWLERPFSMIPNCPVAISSIGVAYHVLQHVVHVEPGSPADEAKIKEGDNIVEFRIVPRKLDSGKMFPEKAESVQLGERRLNWPGAFFDMQSVVLNDIELDVKSLGEKDKRTVTLSPKHADDWYIPVRGLRPTGMRVIKQAENSGEAISLGIDHTMGSFAEMYLTIRRLASRRISHKAVGGPITIAGTAFHVAKEGYGDLLLFLATLSVSLAVLNFLPIPVLDGGHFAFLLWEGIRGKPASDRVVAAATWLGLGMVLSLMIYVFWMDISRLIG